MGKVKIEDIIRREAAAAIGAEIEKIELDTYILTFADGEETQLKAHDFGLNRTVPAKIMKDKISCASTLAENGFNTPRTRSLFRKPHLFEDLTPEQLDFLYLSRAIDFIEEVDYPVFIKPNLGSQGRDVFRIDGRESLTACFAAVADKRGDYVIQKGCKGDEYRVVALNGEIVLAYRKEALELTGDGQNTIEELLKNKIADLRGQGRVIKLNPGDPRIPSCLASHKMTLATVPGAGEKVRPIPNVNLSQGASLVECTEDAKKRFGPLCKELHDKLNLNWFGLDVIAGKKSPRKNYHIIEINGSPGFSHFANFSPGNVEILKQVYTKVFQALHAEAVRRKKDRQPVVGSDAGTAALVP